MGLLFLQHPPVDFLTLQNNSDCGYFGLVYVKINECNRKLRSQFLDIQF